MKQITIPFLPRAGDQVVVNGVVMYITETSLSDSYHGRTFELTAKE